MNLSSFSLELAVIILALGIILVDLWTPVAHKAKLGYVAALGVLLIFVGTFCPSISGSDYLAFNGMYLHDGLALFFKRFFLITAFFVLLMSVEFADRIRAGIAEFYVLLLFALTGMMFAASAHDFIMVFVALELITVSFYILVSFQRYRLGSLEAGVKYLIIGAVSTGFLVFGIALIFGAANTTNFATLQANATHLASNNVVWLGVLFVLVGLGFKIAAFPVQIWAPDVYQGAPTPATAFLAIGSKAAGFVVLVRVIFEVVHPIAEHWKGLLMAIAAITILYGNLCAIPQRNLKRLLGYSSIANAGYLLMGIASLNKAGSSAILYYLLGYLFTLAAAFIVILLVARETEDISELAGLNQRSPLLAASLALAMVSLAGIPPLAGFFGKFLLLKSIIEQGAINSHYYWLAGIAVVGVVISLYYYFGVIRAIYWSKDPANLSPITVSIPMKVCLAICIVGMLYLGVYPNDALKSADKAVAQLSVPGLVHATR
ncbi:MAG: NADH-quinone oxidoreductase subunit [Verrucomicrobiales bacterium]|nr:NADH-quinone oxidoreductase subunit [Verrucomicrobiales bacterium]